MFRNSASALEGTYKKVRDSFRDKRNNLRTDARNKKLGGG